MKKKNAKKEKLHEHEWKPMYVIANCRCGQQTIVSIPEWLKRAIRLKNQHL